MEAFVEDTVARYTPDTFASHFRMSHEKVDEVTQLFGRELTRDGQVPAYHQILLSVWLLANHVSFRAVADRFNVTKSCAWNLFMNFCATCARRANEFITWPVSLDAVNEGFRRTAGFPDVVGCVDGTHVPITMPVHHGHQYINRKGVPSIILLAVCDHELKFTWVNAGWAGSVHDARVYRNELQPILEGAGAHALIGEGHVLGDAAFPLSTWMMVPFRDNGHLSEAQTSFNTRLSSTRMAIERAFGRLKGKFRRLKMLDMLRVDLIPNVIVTACVLHNITLSEGDDDDGEADNRVVAGNGEIEHGAGEQRPGGAAVGKRNELVAMLWGERGP